MYKILIIDSIIGSSCQYESLLIHLSIPDELLVVEVEPIEAQDKLLFHQRFEIIY